MTSSGIPILQNSNSIAILMWLLDNGGAGKQQLYDAVSHTSSMSIRVDELVSAGLIDIEPPNRRRRSSALWLTDTGKEIAEHLKAISFLLGEQSPPASSDIVRFTPYWIDAESLTLCRWASALCPMNAFYGRPFDHSDMT